MIKNLKLRLNLDVEAEKRVYDYLQNSERSISKEAIRSINDYLDLIEERKIEDRFLDRVTATIQDNLKALTPLLNLLTLTQPVAQPQQAVSVSEEKDMAAPLFVNVAVNVYRAHTLGLEILRQGRGDGDAAVPSAGTADSDRKTELSLLQIQRQQEVQQILHLFHKGARLDAVKNILGDRPVETGERAQLLQIEGVRKETHVEHQIRVQRHPVFEAESLHRDL